MLKNILSQKKFIVLAIVVLSAIAWSSSLTTEFTGYDDVKLIVRNEHIRKGLFHVVKFYGNFVTDSHNIAWTNFPTVIYRPLEWFGSAIGYSIWKDSALAFHFFYNFSLHIINSVLIFFILFRLLKPKAIENKNEEEDEHKPKKKKIKKFTDISKSPQWEEGALSDTARAVIAGIITLIWSVHPLHNEAINMITSGVGFLSAMFFFLTAILINLHTRNFFLVLLSAGLCYLAFLGSEMTLIMPFVLIILFAYRGILAKRILHISVSIITVATYMMHRQTLVSEYSTLQSSDFATLLERVFVLAPQVFFHYIKLLVFPKTLTMDEHHQVVLDETFSLYHLVCLGFGLVYLAATIYFALQKDRQKKFIAMFLFLGVMGIAIALNIFPLYCLARDRYTYIFTFGCISALVMIVYKFVFATSPMAWCKANNADQNSSAEEYMVINSSETEEDSISTNSNGSQATLNKAADIVIPHTVNHHSSNNNGKASAQRFFLIFLCILVPALMARSFVRSIDWRNGENFWLSASQTTKDIGAQEIWLSKLLSYYKDPGTDTFRVEENVIKARTMEFLRFPFKHNLIAEETVEKYRNLNKPNGIIEKYGYRNRKTIASALFFFASHLLTHGQKEEAIKAFKLGHRYDEDNFQINMQLLIHLGSKDPKLFKYFIKPMARDAYVNPFLAKGLMDALYYMGRNFEGDFTDQKVYFATKFHELYPSTQAFNMYYFYTLIEAKKPDEAYQAALEVSKKFSNDPKIDEYIKKYEETHNIEPKN